MRPKSVACMPKISNKVSLILVVLVKLHSIDIYKSDLGDACFDFERM